MQQHDALLQKWLSDEDLHTYKAEFRSYKEKTDIFSAQTIWTERALGVDAHVWWHNWGLGKKGCCTTSPHVSRASQSRSAQLSDVGRLMRTSTAPNETDLAPEQQSSHSRITTCASGTCGRIRPLSRCLYHRWS